ncbi:MAG: hypothetical protein HQL66_15740, partial [Magnetococcales bacterium]|nr:hypothetical protein [Magnetococcales bacterium]
MTRRLTQSTERRWTVRTRGWVRVGLLVLIVSMAGRGFAAGVVEEDIERVFPPPGTEVGGVVKLPRLPTPVAPTRAVSRPAARSAAVMTPAPAPAKVVYPHLAAYDVGEEDAHLRPGIEEMDEAKKRERYTFSVNNMPVRDLIAGLARDTKMNVDIYPGINARVTLSVVDQTLPQILDRITRQAGVRAEMRADNVISVVPDRAFTRLYQVDYVNPDPGADEGSTSAKGGKRKNKVSGEADAAMAKAGSGARDQFWDALRRSVQSILDQNGVSRLEESVVGDNGQKPNIVAINQDAGVVTVHATGAQHLQIRELVDRILENAHRQVLIESTVVEVDLSARYQDGIDWASLAGPSAGAPAAGAQAPNSAGWVRFFPLPTRGVSEGESIDAMVHALEQFGTVKVLSRPKIMALNNQTAVLKMVENKIYFALNGKGERATVGYDSKVRTVPVGLVMRVTPQIDAN